MNKKSQKINTGGGAYIGGSVNTNGGKFVGRDDFSQSGMDGEIVASLFRDLFAKIDARSSLSLAEKEDLKSEIEELRNELAMKESANESVALRHLRNIGRMAPDILEVTLATITNPVAGFGLVAKKVAEKVKSSAR